MLWLQECIFKGGRVSTCLKAKSIMEQLVWKRAAGFIADTDRLFCGKHNPTLSQNWSRYAHPASFTRLVKLINNVKTHKVKIHLELLLKFKEWMQLCWTAGQLADCCPTKRIKQSCWYYSAGPLVIGLHFSGADSSRRDSLIGEDDKTWRGRRYPDKMVIMVPRNLAWGLSSTGGGRGWKQDIFETSLN